MSDLKHLPTLVSNPLPFLKEHGWPKRAKVSGESKFGFSEDDEMAEAAAKEMIHHAHAGDHANMMKAFSSLIDVIRNKNHDAFEDPGVS